MVSHLEPPTDAESIPRYAAPLPDQQFQRELASYGQEQDLYKHLATLSTGSVLLLVTFLEKLFARPSWKPLVAVALVAFLVAIVAALGMQLMSVVHVDSHERMRDRLTNPLLAGSFVVLGFGSFLVGIGALVAFALKNL